MTAFQDAPPPPPAEEPATAPLPVSKAPGATFFKQVGAVLAILHNEPGGAPGDDKDVKVNDHHLAAVRGLDRTAGRWEPLMVQLMPFPVEVLEYVARMCRAREGQVNRRAMTVFGSVRGTGMLGLFAGALALTAPIGAVKLWFPTTEGWVVLLGAVIVISLFLSLGTGALAGAHAVSHLAYYADALDAVVALKKGRAADR